MDDFPADRDGARALPSELRTAARAEAPASPASPARSGGATDIDLGALISLVWRRKMVVVVFGLAFALIAIAAVYAVTPRYKASSVVMLDRSEEQFIDVQSVVSGVATDYFAIIAEAEVLKSRALAGRVVDELNLTENPLFNPDLDRSAEPILPVRLLMGAAQLLKDSIRGAVTERENPGRDVLPDDYFIRKVAIDRLLEWQGVQSIDSTYVYRITVETEDPLLSAQIANTFAELYITDQLETKFEATQAATEWLSERVAELQIQVEESEASVESFNSGATLISEQSLAAAGRQLKELRERRDELGPSIAAQRERVAAMQAAIAARDIDAMVEIAGQPRLAQLARTLEELRAGGAGQDTLEVREERLFAAAQALAEQAEAETARSVRQIEAVEGSIAELETQLAEQTDDLVELRQLMRKAEADRRIYEQFLRRLNETTVQEGVQQADARVLSPAVVSFDPSYPRKTLTVLIAGFFGGLAGIGFVLLIEWTNRSFRTAEELEEAVGLPVMGQIPAAPVRRRRDLLTYAKDRSSSSLMEAIRNLRTGVLLANVDRQPKVILLTSSLPKEGKTTCSLLLAQNAAALGRKVLLIECDLRRRTFRTYFDLENSDGLMSVLSGEKTFEEVVHHDADTGLDVIPGQETKVNAADVFSSQRFREFLEDVRERYDFVVVDTPPVLAVPDARVIAPLVDAVLYCVRWNSTHQDLVRNGVAAFSQIRVRVSGLALTQINLKKMAAYGYGGYGYYYYRSAGRYYVN